MKRTRSQTEAALYNPQSDLERVDYKLAVICILAGITEDNLDLITIDDIVSGLRNNFHYSSPSAVSRSHSAIDFLRTENYHLVTSARRYWWHRQIIKGVIARG
jgi:hypothetical protein